jgi:nucleoside-diphosphate-sugar epimerase
VNDLAAAVGRASHCQIVVDHIDRRDIDNIRRRVVNIEKIRHMLRWSPQVTLDRGLEQTVRWFEETGLLTAPATDTESAPPAVSKGASHA